MADKVSFYQFITKPGCGINKIDGYAGGKKDGIITLNEFTNFISTNLGEIDLEGQSIGQLFATLNHLKNGRKIWKYREL